MNSTPKNMSGRAVVAWMRNEAAGYRRIAETLPKSQEQAVTVAFAGTRERVADDLEATINGGETHELWPSRSYRMSPEHANSVLLRACAMTGLTEEETIAELWKRVDGLEREMMRILETKAVPMIASASRCVCPRAGGLRETDSACPEHGDARGGQGVAQ